MEESVKYHIPEDIPANERTAFHGAAAAAAKDGKKSFNFGGKTHPVTMKKDTAKAIADQKEATHTTDFFVGHKHATKAGMGVKVHSKGPDGDNVSISHSDPKKLQKYVDNHLGGGKIKEGYGSMVSPETKARVDAKVPAPKQDPKTAKLQKKIDGMKKMKKESVKKESLSFREKLMSLYEGDRASHYKGATAPEGMHDKMKSSKGAMDMVNVPKSVEADGMKAAKDTAAAIKKSAPGKKMRKGDQNKGDLSIKPSATPVKDPSAKIITAEEYGMFGKKVANSLLRAISVVENYTHEFDVDSEKNAHHMVKKAKEAGMKAKIHTMNGPGGGNPVVHIGHKDTKHMHKFIKKHYDDSYSHDDLNIHKM